MVAIGLDTNLFIYFFQDHPEFGSPARNVFKLLTRAKTRGITSIISLIELLSLVQDARATERLRNLYLQIPNLATVDVGQTVGMEAARIRRTYGFRTADAIQLATGLVSRVTKFITNNKRLKNFKELKVEILEKL